MALVVVSMCNLADNNLTQDSDAQLRLGVFFLGSSVPVTVSFNARLTICFKLNFCFPTGLVSTRRHCLGCVEQLSNRARPSANSRYNIYLRPFRIPSPSHQSPCNTSGCDRPLSQPVRVDDHGIQCYKELLRRLNDMEAVAFLYHI